MGKEYEKKSSFAMVLIANFISFFFGYSLHFVSSFYTFIAQPHPPFCLFSVSHHAGERELERERNSPHPRPIHYTSEMQMDVIEQTRKQTSTRKTRYVACSRGHSSIWTIIQQLHLDAESVSSIISSVCIATYTLI